ncbi:MAG: hypothetical protein V4736_14070 [Bdellovibrionota bacterium]
MQLSLLSDFRKVLKITLMGIFLFGGLSCAGNFFEGLSNKTTEEALYEDALKLIDSGEYTAAIAKLLSLPAEYRARREVIGTLSGAYASRCGQDFFTMVSNMGSSSGAPMLFFMNMFTSTSVSPADCYSAQTTLEQIGGSSARTASENFYMFFLGMSKVGTTLRKYADANQDGVMDVMPTTATNFNSCTSTVTSTASLEISDDDVKQVITGLGLVFDNVASVSASLAGNSAITDFNTFKTTCAALTGVPNCAITNPNDPAITATVISTFRELLRTTDLGITGGTGPCNSTQITGLLVPPCC